MSHKLPGVQINAVNGWRQRDPLPYTASPWRLLIEDIRLGFQACLVFDELYPSLANLWTIGVHVVLIIVQLAFLLSIPLLFTLPIPGLSGFIVLYVISFYWVNHFVCLVLLNGFEAELHSRVDMSHFPSHDDEEWIFVNGIAAGHLWLQDNIDRIAMSFGRPVTGVHNPTAGIVFDLLQCFIQRDFTYATPDIRNAYAAIKLALCRDSTKKVVLILHSQGGIEGGLALDWLLGVLPGAVLAKLETYTFGCAANHFNNPERLTQNSCQTDGGPGEEMDMHPLHSWSRKSREVCGYIEHYADTQEFVARWGVLHFDSWFTEAGKKNRYRGRVFERDAPGHLFNQHYMNGMFPLDRHRGWGILEHNEFMDSVALVYNGGGPGVDDEPCPASQVVVRNLTFPLKRDVAAGADGETDSQSMARVGSLSRLWQYRNGQTVRD